MKLSINQKKSLKWIQLSLIAAFCLQSLARPADVSAHTEGKMQLASVPAGPYKITVWTSPDPAEIGEIHVAVAVTLAEDASPVLDAEVYVEVISHNGSEIISAEATTEDSENKFLYEAVIDVSKGGGYEVNITILGSEGADGQAKFDLDVSSNSSIDWVLILFTALLASAALFLYLRSRRQKRMTVEDQ